MQPSGASDSTPTEPPGRTAKKPPERTPKGPPSPLRLFLIGILGLLLAGALAVAIEGVLRTLAGDGRVADLYFVAAAVLTPVLALGLLVQLVTAMTGRTRLLLREVTRFEEEMSAQPPELNEGSRRARERAGAAARRFVHVVGPFATGLSVQVILTEAVALYCVAAGVERRGVAIGLGAEILALFVYLLFFNAMLARLSGLPAGSTDFDANEVSARSGQTGVPGG